MKFIAIKKSRIIFALIGIIAIIVIVAFYAANPLAKVTGGMMSSDDNEIFKINMVTGEFKSETESGEEIESYRWDPGTIFIPKDKQVTISIFGVNGKEHPFIIEGTDVTGIVKKGEETLINLKFNKSGTYRLICTTHETIANNGPMIAYLVVQ